MGEDGKTKEVEDVKNDVAASDKTKSDNPDVDEDELKKQGVEEYLKTLGVDEDEIKSVLEKHKEDEEKNSTELQKAQKELKKALKLLHEEKESNQKAQAQLEALKLGAKPELVDDLIVIATSKVTETKDIKKVISEIKNGNTGKIYFVGDDEEENNTGRTVTRVIGRKKEDNNNKDRKIGAGGFADGILNDMKSNKRKKSFWD